MNRAQMIGLASAFLLLSALTPATAVAGGKAGAPQQGAAPRTATSGSCVIKKVDFVTTNVRGSGTTSMTFVDVPDAAVSFTQGRAGCIIVSFTAESFAAPGTGELSMVQALLDGTTVLDPGEAQLSGDDDEDADRAWARSHAFSWASGPISAGAHTVKIQFRSWFGGIVTISRHTTTVAHR